MPESDEQLLQKNGVGLWWGWWRCRHPCAKIGSHVAARLRTKRSWVECSSLPWSCMLKGCIVLWPTHTVLAAKNRLMRWPDTYMPQWHQLFLSTSECWGCQVVDTNISACSTFLLWCINVRLAALPSHRLKIATCSKVGPCGQTASFG